MAVPDYQSLMLLLLEFTQEKNDETSAIEMSADNSTETPSEALEAAYENLRDELASELLAKLKKTTPTFFERIVVELLVKMGYGGSRADAGKPLGEAVTVALTALLRKINSGLMLSTFRQNDWIATL